MSRTDCLRALAGAVTDELVVVAVSGMIDEWHHVAPRDLNFYTGGMGLAGSVGLGLALARPDRRVVVLDGDGGLLMNLGSLATLAERAPPNLLHLLFDNGTWESSGRRPLPGRGRFDFAAVARGAGVDRCERVSDLERWRERVPSILAGTGYTLAILEVVPGDPVPFLRGDKLAFRYRFAEAVAAAGGES